MGRFLPSVCSWGEKEAYAGEEAAAEPASPSSSLKRVGVLRGPVHTFQAQRSILPGIRAASLCCRKAASSSCIVPDTFCCSEISSESILLSLVIMPHFDEDGDEDEGR